LEEIFNVARFIYRSILWLILPYALFHLLWRSRRQPEYRQHLGERFGFYTQRTLKPIIWLHTVSVGETRAAASLIERLLVAYPDHQILLTHTTPTGRAASEQLYQNKVLRVYLPYDYEFAVQRFLAHFQPAIGVLLETEIWPNLIHACYQRRIPLLLLNARLSEKSFKRYSRFANLTRQALCELAGIAAQTESDAARFRCLGAEKLSVMGNLKYDIEPPSALLAQGEVLRQCFGGARPILLAASTREGEEALILSALQPLNSPKFLLVIVPRHPQRFSQVYDLIEKSGFSVQRRSAGEPIRAETQVLLGDSMGELFAYYAACDVAFIGGSLLPFGGQNLIEACAVGKPVMIGLHTYNFAQASEMAVAQGAALRIENAGELLSQAMALLDDFAAQQKMSEAALHFVKLNQGATARALALIKLRKST
jgi:3-deoxy-D-manno-octulosonic-acid transferase